MPRLGSSGLLWAPLGDDISHLWYLQTQNIPSEVGFHPQTLRMVFRATLG